MDAHDIDSIHFAADDKFCGCFRGIFCVFDVPFARRKANAKKRWIHKIHQTEIQRESIRADGLSRMVHSPHFTDVFVVACIFAAFHRLCIEVRTE